MKKDKCVIVLVALILVTTLAMVAVIPVDYAWTAFFREHRIAALDNFMDQTLFEGEGLGGADPVTFILLMVLVGYILSGRKGAVSRLKAWRPQLGFVLTGGIACNFIMVHSFKWAWGRARPSLVHRGEFPFTHWFQFGPQFITDGTYSGSFPSGHTASAFALMTLAYALMAAPERRASLKKTGIFLGIAVLAYTMVMGISRCMHGSHWLSDTMASMGMGWILIHLFYHRVLNLPLQMAHYDRYGQHPDHPPAWEIRLCLHTAGMALGATIAVLGIRGIFLDVPWPIYLMIPSGLTLGLFFICRWVKLRRRVFSGLV